MKPILLLSLITGAHALPATIESGTHPVPEEQALLPLLQSAPNADTAADQLLAHYQKHRYPAVGVEVIDLANTRKVIVEIARFKNVWLSTAPSRTTKVAQKHFSPLGGSYVQMDHVKSLLSSFHANPLHRAVPQLQPTPDGSAVNVLLKIDQSQSSRFSAGFLNLGAQPLPRERFWIQGEFSDLWQTNSLSTARLSLSPDPSDFHALQLSSRLFRTDQSQLTASLAYSGAQASTFNAYTWQASTQWTSPKSTSQNWTHQHRLSLSFRRSNNALEFGDATNRGIANVFQITLGGTLERKSTNSLTRASANLVLSPFGSDDQHNSLRPGASAEYGIIRTSFWHRQDLPRGWDLIANFGGQWSSAPLLQADQFALGGAPGLRGLPEQFALGDSGYLAGLELRTPVLNLPHECALRPSLFLQTGGTFDQVLDTHTSAITSGLGLQLGYQERLRASLHAGWRLDKGGANIHTQVTWNF